MMSELLNVWHATNSAGEPVCVSGPDDEDFDGLTLNLYLNDEGLIEGVLVNQKEVVISAVGKLPASIFIEEFQYEGSVNI